MELEKTLAATLNSIKEYIDDHDCSPTIKELVELTGIKSISTMVAYIKILEFYEYITIQEGKPRTIIINKNYA